MNGTRASIVWGTGMRGGRWAALLLAVLALGATVGAAAGGPAKGPAHVSWAD